MISSVNANTSSNVSFNGIVKLKGIYFNGELTSDSQIINSAIRKVKKVLMKQGDTPKNQENLSKMRQAYHYFDKDYRIPAYAPCTDAREEFAHVANRSGHYFISGKDAYRIADAGEDYGKSKFRSDDCYFNAKDYYHKCINGITDAYQKDATHPVITLFMGTGKGRKKGLYTFILENDTHKFDMQKVIAYYKDLAAKMLAKKTAKKAQTRVAQTVKTVEQQVVKKEQPKVEGTLAQATKPATDFFKGEKTISITEALQKKTKSKSKVNDAQMDFFDKLK